MSAFTTTSRVLVTRRVAGLLLSALLARVAGAATPLALLVALAHPYGFGTAAFVDGVYTLILACLGPLRSRIVDHLGQRKALLVMGVLSAVALGGVAFLINVSAPWQLVLALVVIAGLVSPPLSAAVRVSWRQVVNPETDELKMVHSADSVITEVGFILGPTLAGLGIRLSRGEP